MKGGLAGVPGTEASAAAWRRSEGAARSGPGPPGPELRPVDAPGAAHADPDQGPAIPGRRRQREVVEVVDPAVEAAGVRRVREAELLPIEVMAELVQQRMEEATVGRQLAEHGRAHPDPDPFLLEVVVAEELELSAFPDAPRPGPEYRQRWAADPIRPGEQVEHRFSLGLDAPCVAEGERLFQKRGAGLEIASVGERHQAGERIARLEFALRLAAPGGPVRAHGTNLTRAAAVSLSRFSTTDRDRLTP